MKFALLRSDVAGEGWQIHAVGCKHSKRFNPRTVHVVEAEDPEALIESELDMNNGEYRKAGWTKDDFRIMPCVRRGR